MKSDGIKTFRAAQDLHQQNLRQGILDDASNLLMREGANALTMRRIAKAVGCSTTVLYTMFGSKQGLVDELYLKGFEMLRQALASVPHPGNSQDYIYALCYAYRSFALANSTYYSMMFFLAIPEYVPSQTNLELGQKSLELVVQAIQECIAPRQAEDEAWEIARTIWATVHGHVGLELGGYFRDSEASQQRLKRVLQTLADGLLLLGDHT